MKSKMRKKLIAFMLCMVLVICNSVSLLADAPAAATTTTEKQVKETGTAKSEGESEEEQSADDEKDTSEQSDEESAPETETTEKKEETTEATTEDKEDATTATTTKAKEETTEATETSDKDQTTGAEDDSDKKDETSGTSEESKETTEEASTEKAEETTQSPAYDGKYEDSTVTISVSAEAGIVPEGAELSVTPIVKTDITDDMSDEDKVKAEEVNAQYDLTEKKLNEDSAENEETMEGFLAYDISFLVNGEEVEPSGDVKVVMDFKEAAIPEGVSEDAAVAVKHLKEDENAEDGVVVEDMAEKADVQTTDKAEVEKVELTAESFSIYTIEWSNDRGLTVRVVDTNGGSIGRDGEVRLSGTAATVEEIASQITVPDGYEFKEARAGRNFSDSSKIKALRYSGSRNEYKTITESGGEASERWSRVNNTVYFVYDRLPGAIQTADTSGIIQLNLFDYVLDADGNGTFNERNDNSTSPRYDGDDEGINENHAFKFQSYGGARPTGSINASGGNNTNSDIVESKLVDGFPKLNRRKVDSDGESLAYLFNTTPIDGIKSVHSGLTNLFTYNEETGYYSYDSNKNYAYLDLESNPDNKSFTVYNTTANDVENRSQFFPFTKYSVADGAARGPKTGVDLDCNAEQNHYFGMTMTTTFIQPQGGQIDGQDMIFSFSGDDDVWVYIDGVLVLDIGGSHSAIEGTINFNTGIVTVNGEQESLADILRAGGVSGDKLSGNTLRNYRDFTMNFFYLERGNYDSNCKLEFNLASIPSQSVMVTKDVTNENGQSVDYTTNIEFLFEISYEEKLYAYQEYQIWENGRDTGRRGRTNTDGEFTLKNGESAVFPELNVQSSYEVKEKGAYLNGYEVTIDGTTVTDETGDVISSGKQTVGDTPVLVFHNQISDTATLSISKHLENEVSDTDTPFAIQVSIDGSFYNGTYQIYEGDSRVEGGTAREGWISLKANQTAKITGLPYGVRFEIEESLNGLYRPTYEITGNVYNPALPDFDEEGNQNVDENGDPTSTVTSAAGNVAGDVEVNVTNHKVNIDSGTTSLTVTKTWEDGTEDIRPDAINVTLYQDNNNNDIRDEGDTVATGITATVQLNEENKWTYTWSNLPADTNFVVEESEVEAGDLEDFESNLELTSSFEFSYLDRVTTCSNLTYLLGKNNMLLVKLTSNSGYLLWTPINLGLSDAEVQEISSSIKQMRLPGSGNLSNDLSDGNLRYVWGTTDPTYTNGIRLSQTDTGWKLNFGASSNWAQFWNLQYDRTIAAGIENKLKNTIDIPVEKQWSGDMQMWENVKYITVQLYRNNEACGTPVNISKNQDGKWTYTFENLDKYYKGENGKYMPYEYRVEETLIYYSEDLQRDPSNPDGFTVEYSGNAEEGFQIENIWVHDWQIRKVSSTDSDIPLALGGAEFILTEEGASTPSYYGATYDYDKYLPKDIDTAWYYVDGKVYWWKEEANKGTIAQAEKYIEDGTYILKETKAPDGYLVNSVTWTIEIEDLAVVRITDSNGQTITKYTPGASTRAAIQVDSYLFEDTPIYELPSAGGPGIYWYTLSGTLLMAGAALIVYRQKRKREVLLRK